MTAPEPRPDWHNAQVIEATTDRSPNRKACRNGGDNEWESLRDRGQYWHAAYLSDVRVIVDANGQVASGLPDPKAGCICWLPPEKWDTSYYGIPEPGSQMEYDPTCPEHSYHVYDPRTGVWIERSDAAPDVRRILSSTILPTAEVELLTTLITGEAK